MEHRTAIPQRRSAFRGGYLGTVALGVGVACFLAWAVTALVDKRMTSSPPDSTFDRKLSAAPRAAQVLSPGESGELGEDGVQVRRLPKAELTSRLAWTSGLIKLDGQTLAEAVEEFNRYNRRKLRIDDPAIAELRVSGTFKAKEPEQFVATLQRSSGVRALASDSRDSDSQVIRLVGTKAPR